MVCSHHAQSQGRVVSAWTPGGVSHGGCIVAERMAREVLQDATGYHRRFGFGFEYQSTNGRFAITEQTYARLLSSFGSLDFNADASLREGAFASYGQRDDIVNFTTANLAHPAARGAMLHELIHAYQDLESFRGLHLEIEATAYLAQALWVAADEVTHRFPRATLDRRLQIQATQRVRSSGTPIYIEAARLCLGLGLHRAPRILRRSDLAPLEAALRASEAYRGVVDVPFRGDGFRR